MEKTQRIAELNQRLETMHQANAYYRKNHTMTGFQGLPIEAIDRLNQRLGGNARKTPFSTAQTLAARNAIERVRRA